MSDSKSKTYHGKVLLFGEYTIMDGSAAIAVPFDKFGGHWSLDNDNPSSKAGLQKLKKYVAQLYYKGQISGVDFDSFERDLTRGVVFESSIPTGYGLGSSGALTAAFFDTYIEKKKQYDLPELKAKLSLIESCFHGTSSGLDPLVSLLHMPLMVHPDGDIEILDNNDREDFLKDIRLLDTGIARETRPLVEAYKKTIQKSEEFLSATKQLAELTDLLITDYVLGDVGGYISRFKDLSKAQLDVLSMLIPLKYQHLWQEGLRNDAFYMKLCGAGGGGYLLMHIKDELKAAKLLDDQNLISII